MKFSLPWLSTLLLLCNVLCAQHSYEPAYIITTEGDTISGYILNNLDSELSRSITFKRDLHGSDKAYTPEDLDAFAFDNGRTFKGMSLISPKEKWEDGTKVFAKRILSGKVDLYVRRLNGGDDKDYFVINNATGHCAYLPPPMDTIEVVDGLKRTQLDNRYKRYMGYVQHDMAANTESRKLDYSEKSIRDNVKRYNGRYQDIYPMSKYHPKRKHLYHITAGIPVIWKAKEARGRIGVFRNTFIPERSIRWSFMMGMSYSHVYIWQDLNPEHIDYRARNGSINYRSQLINIVLAGIKYTRHFEKFSPYLFAGLGPGLMIRNNHRLEEYKKVEDELDYAISPFLPTLGAGGEIKVGSHKILAEITPTLNGVYFNMGIPL